MTLLQPAWLLLLLIIPFFWLGPWSTPDRAHAFLRSIVFLCLALGLARPVRIVDGAHRYRVWILDRSASVEPGVTASATAQIRAGLADGRADRDILITLGPAADDELRRAADETLDLGTGSDLAAALMAAAAAVPQGHGGSVVLASDGLATRRTWGDATAALVRRRLPVSVLPLEHRAGDARVVGLVPQDELRVGATTRIDVVIDGTAAGGRLAVALGSTEPTEVEVAPGPGRRVVAVTIEPSAAGWFDLSATLTAPGDATPGNETLGRLVAVQDPWRIAYLGPEDDRAAERLGTLLGPGFEVTATADAASSALAECDLVMLDDLPATSFPAAAQTALVERVRDDGAGLVMSGGRHAFGPGGWHDTPVAGVLPVELVQREEKRDPSTALVIVIDTSGSMGGQRVQLAKEVARLAIRRLLPHDKVGIVEFYGAKRWAAPLQPASNAIELERALNRLDAGGGTVILPAIEEAFYGLQNVSARYKHVLVLTDGGIESGAFEPLLRSMAEEGINVSTVLTGGAIHSEFLVTLANWGKGRFYSVPNRYNLPEILLKQPSSAKLPGYRPGTATVRARGGAGWWGELDPSSVPALSGYVETRARPGAQVVLETVDAGHPVLATWRYGLGRVTTLATEPVGPGTAGWADWTDYGRFLARALRRTLDDAGEPFRVDVAYDGDEVVLTTVRRGAVAAVPDLRHLDDAGAADALALRQRSPGRHDVRFVAPADPWRIELTAGTHRRRLVVDPVDFVRAETQVDPEGGLDLVRLAEATGGAVLTAGTVAPAPPAPEGGRRGQRWWPWLLLASLAAYIGDVAWRRRASA